MKPLHILILVLVFLFLFIGFAKSNIVVVQERCDTSFDLFKGIVYDIDLWVKNEGSNPQNVQVTVDLIATSTGQTRDERTQIVNLRPNETKQLRFTLDGERGIQYHYKYYTKTI